MIRIRRFLCSAVVLAILLMSSSVASGVFVGNWFRKLNQKLRAWKKKRIRAKKQRYYKAQSGKASKKTKIDNEKSFATEATKDDVEKKQQEFFQQEEMNTNRKELKWFVIEGSDDECDNDEMDDDFSVEEEEEKVLDLDCVDDEECNFTPSLEKSNSAPTTYFSKEP